MQEQKKELDFGIWIRTKIVFAEFLARFIELFYVSFMLLFQLIFSPFMIFSQKHYNALILTIRKHINDK